MGAIEARPRILGPDGAPLPPSRRGARMLGEGFGPYDGAERGTSETDQWFPWLSSPDLEINQRRDLLVARMRDLVRNDGWAAGGVTRMLDSVIGGSFRLVAKPDWRTLALYANGFDADWAEEFRRAAEALFRTWANDPGRWCDAQRRVNFSGLCRLAFRSRIVDGEALVFIKFFVEF